MDKIKAVRIELNRVEGPFLSPRYFDKVVFDCQTAPNSGDVWRSADSHLTGWAMFMKDWNTGYDKVQFKVVYEDGKSYEGRIDIEAKTSVSLDLHIWKFASFWAGLNKPDHIATMEAYENLIEKRRNAFIHFLVNYEVGEFDLVRDAK